MHQPSPRFGKRFELSLMQLGSAIHLSIDGELKVLKLFLLFMFVSGKAPSFSMPDLALGCLMKPVTADDVHRSLAAAEDLLRGRQAVRAKPPQNLKLYDPNEAPGHAPEPAFIPTKLSLRTRLEHWISRQHQ